MIDSPHLSSLAVTILCMKKEEGPIRAFLFRS
jgi:hypothetical protein